ncbi:MAG: hypothetical protein KJZ59_00200, partial [Pararhodobacter sp.]|nr:hypothetical protein [Pararhodobacter sp.]
EAARRAAQSDAEQAKAAARLQEMQGKLDAALADRAAAAKAQDAAHDAAMAAQRAPLDLALRLQAMARADQAELQARYAALQRQKDEQDDLILQLTHRLQSAALNLHDLIAMSDSAELPAVIAHDSTDAVQDAGPDRQPKGRKSKKNKKGGKPKAAR